VFEFCSISASKWSLVAFPVAIINLNFPVFAYQAQLSELLLVQPTLPLTGPAVCTAPKKCEASGFCYINDINLAILELLLTYPRVLY
jgi:hypothetical protein